MGMGILRGDVGVPSGDLANCSEKH
jgi:hypothetical protein